MVKETLRQHLGNFFSDSDLNRWFDPLDMHIDRTKDVLNIFFPHQYFGNWFMDTVKDGFERGLADFAQGMRVSYQRELRTALLCPVSGLAPAKDGASKKNLPHNIAEEQDMLPDSHCSFDSFLVNRKNDFPLAAARDYVCKAGRPLYTPFVLYGQSGSGKSHLLGAMARALNRDEKPLYFGGIAYLKRLHSLADGISTLDERYVFIDDAQGVSACSTMQDALSALIDTFQSSGRLLALAFDAHPTQCAGLGQKLRSRLVAGLVVEIKRPDLDIRRQYVQRKNSLSSLALSKEQILDIAHRHQDIRSIDGVLARISAYRALYPAQDADASSADLSSILNREEEHAFLTPLSIILAVAREFSLPPEELTGKSRGKNISLARHIAMLLCRELLGLSLIQTGRIFSGRDHSSVLYSIKKIKQLQLSDKHMHKRVEELRKLCLTRH